MLEADEKSWEPVYVRVVLVPLVIQTVLEVVSSFIPMILSPREPSMIALSLVLASMWVALFFFLVYRKLINPQSRSRYMKKWKEEGRPTSYGAV